MAVYQLPWGDVLCGESVEMAQNAEEPFQTRNEVWNLANGPLCKSETTRLTTLPPDRCSQLQ